MFCIACGGKNPDHAKFCFQCGKVMSELPPSGQSQALPQPAAPPPAATTASDAVTPKAAPPKAPKPPSQPHPQFAPPSTAQAAAAAKSKRRGELMAIPVAFAVALGIVALSGAASWAMYVGIVAGGIAFVSVSNTLVPSLLPPRIPCPHCGKAVGIVTKELPKKVWPWACPHCSKALA